MCYFLAGLDIGPITDDPSLTSPPSAGGRSSRPVQDEPLDAILSPELDKIVTDGETTLLHSDDQYSFL